MVSYLKCLWKTCWSNMMAKHTRKTSTPKTRIKSKGGLRYWTFRTRWFLFSIGLPKTSFSKRRTRLSFRLKNTLKYSPPNTDWLQTSCMKEENQPQLELIRSTHAVKILGMRCRTFMWAKCCCNRFSLVKATFRFMKKFDILRENENSMNNWNWR